VVDHTHWAISHLRLLSPLLLTLAVGIAKDKYDLGSTFFPIQRWKLSDVILVQILIFLIQYTNTKLISNGIITLAEAYIYGALFLYLVIAASVYGIIRIKYRLTISALGIHFRGSVGNILLGLKTWSIFELFFFLLPLIIGKHELIYNRAQKSIVLIVSDIPGHQVALYILGAVVLAPIVEESLFRGFIYSPFRRRIGHKSTAVLSSLIWSLGHYDVGFSGGLVVLGIIFIYLYAKTGSLLPSIVVHAGISFTGLLIFLYLIAYQRNSIFIETKGFIMWGAFFFLAASIVLFIISRQKHQKRTSG